MNSRVTLKKNSDFHRLYARGKSAVSPYLVVYCRKNRGGVSRFGYTVSAKLGHAVVRNRVRRRIREAYRLSESEYRRGYDIVVVARTRAAEATYREIADCLKKQSERLGLIRKEEPREDHPAVDDPVLPDAHLPS